MDQFPHSPRQPAFVVLSVLILTGASTYLFMPQAAHGTSDCSAQIAAISSLADEEDTHTSALQSVQSSIFAQLSSLSSDLTNMETVSDATASEASAYTLTESSLSSAIDTMNSYSSLADIHQANFSSLADVHSSIAAWQNSAAFSSALSDYDTCINN